jgi:hypothetical protein
VCSTSAGSTRDMPVAGFVRCKAPLALVVVTCETWRYQKPRGPHFSLTLFGPSHPTRAVTAPAWC